MKRLRKDIEEVKERVLERIKPTKEEETELRKKGEEITGVLKEILDDLGYEATVEILGSFAKGTRIRGKKELDVFILVPPKPGITRKNYIPMFERLVRDLIEKIPRKYELRYANHPYIRVFVDRVQADVVPGFLVEDPSHIISPVDRSPYHAKFVKERLSDKQKDEVRLLKQFLKGIRAYGAEIKVQGLSGYACELLIISEGSFERALEAIRRLKFVDPGGRYSFKESFEEALNKGLRNVLENAVMVIVDPVDPKRNVAAALSRRTYAKMRLAIEMFFNDPTEKFFFPPEVPEASLSRDRDMIIYGKIGGASEDVIRGKLRRLVRIIEKRVAEDDNLRYKIKRVYPGTYNDRRYVRVETINVHGDEGKFRGPKVTAGRNAKRFIERYKETRLSGPIEPRDQTRFYLRPPKHLKEAIMKASLGEIRKELVRSKESVASEFFVSASGTLKYPDPREALRHMIKGGMPIEYEGVRPILNEELPEGLKVMEDEFRVFNNLRSDRLGLIIFQTGTVSSSISPYGESR